MIIKKAAMFGLDARIALAIFGALSVISGAALYSAIKHAKVISIVNQMSEITKAYEQYLLDTGTVVRKISEVDTGFTGQGYSLHTVDLLENSGVSGWNGPYLSLSKHPTFSKIGFDVQGFMMGMIRSDSGTWGAAVITPVCSVATTCTVWLQLDSDSASLAKSIDEYVDGSLTLNSGRTRIRNDAPNSVFYNTGIVYTNM